MVVFSPIGEGDK